MLALLILQTEVPAAVGRVKAVISALPPHNRAVLHFLLCHLARVAEHAATNNMTGTCMSCEDCCCRHHVSHVAVRDVSCS